MLYHYAKIAEDSSALVSQKYLHPPPKQRSEPLSVFRTPEDLHPPNLDQLQHPLPRSGKSA
jgi:hypothetical protein